MGKRKIGKGAKKVAKRFMNSNLKSVRLEKRLTTNEEAERYYNESPVNKPNKFISSRCGSYALSQKSAGHTTVKNRRRIVSGIVRAKVKSEIKKEIENERI